jgi:hypothetical protein
VTSRAPTRLRACYNCARAALPLSRSLSECPLELRAFGDQAEALEEVASRFPQVDARGLPSRRWFRQLVSVTVYIVGAQGLVEIGQV